MIDLSPRELEILHDREFLKTKDIDPGKQDVEALYQSYATSEDYLKL